MHQRFRSNIEAHWSFTCVELQELRVSHLAILKEEECLTFPSSLLQTVPEVAWTQHSPAINARMLATSDPEGHTYLVPPPLDPPLQDEATEPPDKFKPEQIQGSATTEELLELLPGKVSQCVMWHNGQLQAYEPEGAMPLRIRKGTHPTSLT
jgi:hypothetical protein